MHSRLAVLIAAIIVVYFDTKLNQMEWEGNAFLFENPMDEISVKMINVLNLFVLS
ncbi:MAG: hypothetical protein R2779_09430 [Crocinitomicaceae bacterium]